MVAPLCKSIENERALARRRRWHRQRRLNGKIIHHDGARIASAARQSTRRPLSAGVIGGWHHRIAWRHRAAAAASAHQKQTIGNGAASRIMARGSYARA